MKILDFARMLYIKELKILDISNQHILPYEGRSDHFANPSLDKGEMTFKIHTCKVNLSTSVGDFYITVILYVSPLIIIYT